MVCVVCGEWSCNRHDAAEHEALLAQRRAEVEEEEACLYEHAKWHWDRLGKWDGQRSYDTAQECWDYASAPPADSWDDKQGW